MAGIKDIIEPKIQYGTIIVFAVQLMIGGALILSDHNTNVENKASSEAMRLQLESVLQILPVTNKTIEINGSRIGNLESEEKQIELRINTLETNYGIAHADLEELKNAVHDIVSASQANSPVYRPRR